MKREDYSDLLTSLMPSPADEPYHLSTAELADYVNDSLEALDREDAESHLEVCDQCRSAVEELRTSSAAQTKAQVPAGWWKVSVWQSRPIQVAALVLVTLILLAFAVWYARNTREPLQAPLQNGSKEEGSFAAASPSPLPTQEQSVDVVAQLSDGGKQIVLNSKDELQGAEHLPPGVQRAIKATLRSQTLEKSDDLKELAGKQSVLLGDPVEGRPFELVSPIAIVMTNNQPTFRWRPLAGATGYIVSVLDARLDEVATSDTLTALEWKIPKRLTGGIYSWQVTAIKDDQRIVSPVLPAPQAKFKILEANRAAEIARVKRDSPQSHLALGILYTRAGMLDDAIRELELLQKENPRSLLVKKLLDQVGSQRSTK